MYIMEYELSAELKRFDTNNSGTITIKQLQSVLVNERFKFPDNALN
jgi:Ca2+-binding EF-hand superfamily protein